MTERKRTDVYTGEVTLELTCEFTWDYDDNGRKVIDLEKVLTQSGHNIIDDLSEGSLDDICDGLFESLW